MRFVIFCLAVLAFAAPQTAFSRDRMGGRIYAFAIDNNSEATILVKPLDDAANPYKDRYSAVDRWAYTNYIEEITPLNQGDWQIGLSRAQGFHPQLGWLSIPNEPVDYGGGLAMTMSTVDENGYVIPAFDIVGEIVAAGGHAPLTLRQEIEKAKTQYTPKHARFWSLGKWNPEVEQASTDAREWYLATAHPPIPTWAASLESDLVLLSDGGVVVIAEVPASNTRIAKRFSAAGTLLKEAPMAERHDWHVAVAEAADPKASPYYKAYEVPMHGGMPARQLDNIEHVGGRYDVLRGNDGQIAAVIDYWQDKELDAAANPAVLDELKVEWEYFQRLDTTRVKAVFTAQQRLGSKHKNQ